MHDLWSTEKRKTEPPKKTENEKKQRVHDIDRNRLCRDSAHWGRSPEVQGGKMATHLASGCGGTLVGCHFSTCSFAFIFINLKWLLRAHVL